MDNGLQWALAGPLFGLGVFTAALARPKASARRTPEVLAS